MDYRKIKKSNNFNKFYKILILTIIVFFVAILPCIVRAKGKIDFGKRNMFYVQVLNYAMPSVKSVSFNEEDMAENKFSLKDVVFQTFGISTNKPMSFVKKEIPFLSLGSDEKQESKMAFTPFKLKDNEVSKFSKDEKKQSKDDLNLQNKVVNLHNPKLKKKLGKTPEVFIYHTHTTESYKPGEPSNFDTSKNVCAVGDTLASELINNYGINTLHDKTVHDAQAYTQSYARSSVTVDKYMKKYKEFKLVIDLHRDSVSNKKAVTAKLNGENAAKFMLVMARKNPHFNTNMKIANGIVNTSNRLFPGLCKGIYYYNYGTRYFNQNKSNNAVLVEVGADCNTTEEAKNTAKYLARIIGECLNK